MLLHPSLAEYNPKWSKIPIITVTGGPRSLKSHMLDESQPGNVITRLKQAGFMPIVRPEIPTIFFASGLRIGEDFVPNRVFQKGLSALGISADKVFCEMALAAEKNNQGRIVILEDRATVIENRAYSDPKTFKAILDGLGTNIVNLRDRLRAGVLHMRTSAFDQRIPYNRTDNNPNRKEETREEAIERDESTLRVWIGTPHLRIVPCFENIQDKLDLAWRYICQMLGYPRPSEIEEKYLVNKNNFSLEDFTVPFEIIDITQFCLKDGPGGYSDRIRMRGQDGNYIYFRTLKKKIEGNEYEEKEKQITEEKFYKHLRREDDNYYPVRKKRVCFVWKEQYFELDLFESPRNDLCLLELELLDSGQKFDLPPFLDVLENVTNDPKYRNRYLAQKCLYPGGIS